MPDLSMCVRCGACKAFCPTYAEIADEVFSARGRAMLLQKADSGEPGLSERFDSSISTCMLCGACNSSCPLGIDLVSAVCKARKKLKDSSRERRIMNRAAGFIFKDVSRSFKLLSLLETLADLLPVQRIEPFKTLRKMGIRPSYNALRNGPAIFKAKNPKGRVAVFAGCTVNYLYPEIGRSLIEGLNEINYDVVLQKGESCCGAPLLGLGMEDEAVELAERNISVFRKLKVEAVLSPCPTCSFFISDVYKRLTGSGIANTVDVSEFFMSKIRGDGRAVALLSGSSGSTVFHDACHARHLAGAYEAPREILKAAGIKLRKTENGCCGFAGSFSITHPGLSESILDKRTREYEGSDTIITNCPNCVLQLKRTMGSKKIRHMAEVICEALKGEGHVRKGRGFRQIRDSYPSGA
ncbi:MAG: (Fe-S)-binding protein [Nitrospirae bacterium]|nr:MAG: (Fe-S)-binding protein [Nitrospirota bacterium]